MADNNSSPDRKVAKAPADPFFSESNIRYLEGIVRDMESGKAQFSEHELNEENECDTESGDARLEQEFNFCRAIQNPYPQIVREEIDQTQPLSSTQVAMLNLLKELLAVEEDRLQGRTGCTIDELAGYLDSMEKDRI